MTTTLLPLKDILPGLPALADRIGTQATQQSGTRIASMLAALGWSKVLGGALEQVGELDLASHLVRWWVKQREIEEALSQSETSERTELVKLVGHDVQLTYPIELDVYLDATRVPAVPIQLEIGLDLRFEGAILELHHLLI